MLLRYENTIMRRPHPTGSVATRPRVNPSKEAERLAAGMIFSLACDLLEHEPPGSNEVVVALKRIADEMLKRSEA